MKPELYTIKVTNTLYFTVFRTITPKFSCKEFICMTYNKMIAMICVIFC